MNYQELISHIDPSWLAQTTFDLVNIPSETLKEQEICLFYAKELEKLGLKVDKREVTPDRYNLYAKLSGDGEGPALALNGHLDTIPIGLSWPAEIKSGRIYGRGSEDMKGGLAAILGTVKAIKESGTKLAGDLWITAVVGHEDAEASKDGPLAMCEDIRSGRIECDSILIAEGDSEIWTMSTGSAVFTISLNSKLNSTHTNNISFKENPIRFVGLIIQAIDAYQDELNAGERHPLAGTAKIDIGKINSGDYYNRTPSLSMIEGIVRWLPDSNAAKTQKKLVSIISPIAQAGDLDFSVSFAMEREPFEVSHENLAVQAVAEATKLINGKSPNFIGKRIVGDANIYMGLTGVPTFYYGPGYQTAHSDSEWVNIEALVKASQIYTLAAINYLGISQA